MRTQSGLNSASTQIRPQVPFQLFQVARPFSVVAMLCLLRYSLSTLLHHTSLNAVIPRGSIWTANIELEPKNHTIYGFGALIPYWQSKWTLWDIYSRIDCVNDETLAMDFGNLYSANGQNLGDWPDDPVQRAIDVAYASQMQYKKVCLYAVDDVWRPHPQGIARARGAGFYPKMCCSPETWQKYITPYLDIKLDKAHQGLVNLFKEKYRLHLLLWRSKMSLKEKIKFSKSVPSVP